MTIEHAVIASIAHLHDLAALGTIDMALTHLVLTEPAYADFYRRRAAGGITVILDNSAYELEEDLGKGMDVGPVLTAAQRIGASIVICQDVLYDGPATVAATRRFLEEAGQATGYRFMAVPQGSTRAQWLACYDDLLNLNGVNMIGLSKLSVPRCFDAPVAEARLDCVGQLLTRGTPPALHLLGGDRSLPWELREHRRRGHDAVRSNDSSLAFWSAACGIDIDPATGRAAHDPPTKPDLTGFRLDQDGLRRARRHVHQILASAAADTGPTAPAGVA